MLCCKNSVNNDIRFWNVSVEFDPGEESTIVEGHCSKLAKVSNKLTCTSQSISK